MEMNDDENFEDFCLDKKDEWKNFVTNDVLCTAFGYARYSKECKR